VALGGREPIPLDGLCVVLTDPLAVCVQITQLALGVGVTFSGSTPMPTHGLSWKLPFLKSLLKNIAQKSDTVQHAIHIQPGFPFWPPSQRQL
jgi:hypothetical protein